MIDKISGFLEVGLNEHNEVVINHPDLKPDENGVGHIVFSPTQARNLAQRLNKHASDAEVAQALAARKAAEDIPVDYGSRTLTDGSPITPGHLEVDTATGMQKGYVVLSAEERAKGFRRPVRRSYTHTTCCGLTTMGLAIAETYARLGADSGSFYSGTYCATCQTHFPLNEFVWAGTREVVGS